MGLKWNTNRLQPVKGLSVPLQSADFSRRSLNNREMIRLGCAKAYPFNGHPYEEDFARAEDEARSAELGLWK